MLAANAATPPPDWLRHAVRGVLEQSPGYRRLQPGHRRALAQAMVKVSSVPLARRQIARQRQQMLATMVMLGMQRIVIDSGRINASMRFHIDTRSAASEDRGSELGIKNRVKAAGSFGVGPWGASAEVENTISYVSTQRSQNTEEINTDLELNSSVELVFKTDYLPLERLAGGPQIERIKGNTLNPEAEAKAVIGARTARDKASRDAESKRSEATLKALAPPPVPPPAKAGDKGTVADAEKARADAAKKDTSEPKTLHRTLALAARSGAA